MISRTTLLFGFLIATLVSFAQETIDSDTEITVCFDANHTYVSDLGFYLIGPQECGSPIVSLAPTAQEINPANGCCCNAGNNIDSLCFTTVTSGTFNMCSELTPLSGVFSGYGNSSNPITIDWSPLFGCPITSGSWRVQIFDCIGSDIGSLTGATLSLIGVGETFSSTIDSVNSPINDNSCNHETASIIQFGVDSILTDVHLEHGAPEFKYMYNPLTRELTINADDTEPLLVKLYDIGGKVIQEEQVNTGQPVQLDHRSGIYFVNAYNVSGHSDSVLKLKLVIP